MHMQGLGPDLSCGICYSHFFLLSGFSNDWWGKDLGKIRVPVGEGDL